ncbi:hypothetical protein ACFS4T_14335 [Pseudomonas lini]
MRKIFLPFVIALLCLHGCAEMPAYSNIDPVTVGDESRYTVVETDTYAGRVQRHYADLQPDLNIIKINDKKSRQHPVLHVLLQERLPAASGAEAGHLHHPTGIPSTPSLPVRGPEVRRQTRPEK